MYRGLDDQVGTPIENATVFKATGKFLNSTLIGYKPILVYMKQLDKEIYPLFSMKL